MFTKCTHCQTTFRVSSEQLKLAAGKVRCGNCREVFNALDNLVEETEAPAANQELTMPEELNEPSDVLMSALDEVSETAPGEDELADMLEDDGLLGREDEFAAPISDAAESMSQMQESLDDFAIDDSDGSSADELLGELEQFGEGLDEEPVEDASQLFAGEEKSPFQEAAAGPTGENTLFNDLEEFQQEEGMPAEDLGRPEVGEDIFDIGAGDESLTETRRQTVELDTEPFSGEASELQFEQAPDRRSVEKEQFIQQELAGGQGGKKFIWSALVLVLLLVLAIQVMYFKRAELMKYPQVVPALETMCSVLGNYVPCDLPLPKDLEAIVMEEREVRSHPNTPNALLISAKIVNRAEFEQPYPLLELSFSDMNQKLIARRTFQPKEYLGKEVDTTKGMPVNIPVRVLLEIVDPGAEAVNFEFNYR